MAFYGSVGLACLGFGCASPDKPVHAPTPRVENASQHTARDSGMAPPIPNISQWQATTDSGDAKPRLFNRTGNPSRFSEIGHSRTDGLGADVSPTAMQSESQRKTPDSPAIPPLAETPQTVPSPSHAGRPDGNITPIDFGTALAIAGGENPRIDFANARIREAFAQWEQAKVLWLPHLRAGASYNRHDGSIQNAVGDVFETNRSSMYGGLGARAVGTGSPAFPGLFASFEVSDAIYQPRIVAQTTSARQHDASAETNDVLLETSLAYLDLLTAMQFRSITEETLNNTQRVAALTETFAKAGQGRQVDADRARTELITRQDELLKRKEDVLVASARLQQLLSVDGPGPLLPMEPAVIPVELVPPERDVASLVAIGLSHRNEVASRQHLIEAACQRLKREKAAPLIPSVLLGVSYGGVGGGQNDFIGNSEDRFDFDAVAYWNVRNLGFGERAARQQMQARVDQAQAEYFRQMDQVAREVIEAQSQVEIRRQRISVTQEAISYAEAAFERDVERIRQNVGLPIEAIQSVRALDAARRNYLQAVADYNAAQFRLQRALGWPISYPEELQEPTPTGIPVLEHHP